MCFKYLVLCIVVMWMCMLPAQGFTLVKNGKCDHSILLGASPSPSEKHAADELQKFIEEISGAKLQIISEPAQSAKMIVIGACNTQKKIAPGMDIASLGEEGFAIKTAGPHLIIAGGKLRGTMYGVYSFLEDVLGCRWYTSSVSKIPKNPTIKFASLDIVQKPDFEYREPFYADAWDADWAARNKSNGNAPKLDEARGGKIEYIRFAHSFDELVPMDKYYKDHPEYYSLINGERIGGQFKGQLCLTNPDVIRIVTETSLKWIAEKPNCKILSVTQNDNGRYCRCDNCKKIDEEEGSPSGLMLRLVNAVAEEVEKKYPNVLIDTFAYTYTEKPPKITKPRHNVRVRLCPILNCQYHPYETCPKNQKFMDNLKGWAAITNGCLYIWHYNTRFYNYMEPLPDLEQIQTTIPLYKRSGVVGIMGQGTFSAGNGPYGGGGFMDDLKQFVLAKIFWNSNIDIKPVRDDFLSGYFGKAGKPIGEYLDLLHKAVRENDIHGTVLQKFDDPKLLTDNLMAKGNELFDEAEKLAESPDELHRIRHARLSIRYMEVMRQAKSAVSGTELEKKKAIGALWNYKKEIMADGMERVNHDDPFSKWYEDMTKPLREQ